MQLKAVRVLSLRALSESSCSGAVSAARIAEGAFEALDAPVRRLAYPDHPVPFNKELEAVCLPDEESIAASLRELAAW